MRDPVPTSDVTAAARDEARLRELDRKASAVSASLDLRASSLEDRVTTVELDYPRGVIARAERNTDSATTQTTQAAAQGVIVLSAPILPGRLYRVWCPDIGVNSSPPGTALVQLTYTLDGSSPTSTSTRMKQSTVVTTSATAPVSVTGHIVSATNATLTVLLGFYGLTAATYTMAGQADWPIVVYIEDIGVDPGPTGTNI